MVVHECSARIDHDDVFQARDLIEEREEAPHELVCVLAPPPAYDRAD